MWSRASKAHPTFHVVLQLKPASQCMKVMAGSDSLSGADVNRLLRVSNSLSEWALMGRGSSSWTTVHSQTKWQTCTKAQLPFWIHIAAGCSLVYAFWAMDVNSGTPNSDSKQDKWKWMNEQNFSMLPCMCLPSTLAERVLRRVISISSKNHKVSQTHAA